MAIYKIKRLSNKYNLPILIITDIVYPMNSCNCFDYKNVLNNLLYGAIGASSNYILALQFQDAPFFYNNLSNQLINIENIKKSNLRKVEITLLKTPLYSNMNSCKFTYNAINNSFIATENI